MNRCYNELVKLKTFDERFRFLKLNDVLGNSISGKEIREAFYTGNIWKPIRNKIIIRDHGCDLGIIDREVFSHIIVHHINPISINDIIEMHSCVLDPNNLICTSSSTHPAIHYGNESILNKKNIERFSNDTNPWRLNNGRQ